MKKLIIPAFVFLQTVTLLTLSIAAEPVPPAAETPPATTAEQTDPYSDLKATIGRYMQAWHDNDFKQMRTFENWEGSDKLNETKYIQTFDSDFNLFDWQVTKVEPLEKDNYKVLVLVTHSLPKQIAGLVPGNKGVNSTLIQWWGKRGDQFVHLFHTEREARKAFLSPPPMEELKVEPKENPEPEHAHEHAPPVTQ